MTAVSDKKLSVGRRVQLTNKPPVKGTASGTVDRRNRQPRQEAAGERRRRQVGSEEFTVRKGGGNGRFWPLSQNMHAVFLRQRAWLNHDDSPRQPSSRC